MFHTKGKPLCPEEKQLLVSVKHYFDRNKTEFGSRESAAKMTADALGIGLATVNRVMANYRKEPQSIKILRQLRGPPAYSIDVSHIDAVRAYIRKANLEGHHINGTLDELKEKLGEGKKITVAVNLRTFTNHCAGLYNGNRYIYPTDSEEQVAAKKWANQNEQNLYVADLEWVKRIYHVLGVATTQHEFTAPYQPGKFHLLIDTMKQIDK